jgi:hypothetical protein
VIVYTDKSERFILSAYKAKRKLSSSYIISMDHNNFELNTFFIAKLKSNFFGTEFNIYDNWENPKKSKGIENTRQIYGTIKYDLNLFGLKGYTKMNVYLPYLDSDKMPYSIKLGKQDKNLAKFSEIKSSINNVTTIVKKYINKQPKFSQSKFNS